jgi:hypothetical protein
VKPRTCPVCGTENEETAEACGNCGEPLSAVGRIFGHAAEPSQPVWLEQARGRAPDLKERGRQASDVRMDGLTEIDRKREAWQAERAAFQREKDRKVLMVAMIGSGVFLLLVLGLSLSALLR